MYKVIQLFGWLALISCNKSSGPSVDPDPAPVVVPVRVVNVSTAAQLKTALANAKPGDDIVMADGIYKGRFVIEANAGGTSANPITLRGSRNAMLDGESTNTGYVLHLQASYWIIKGFTMTNGLKGIMIDGSRHSLIDGVKIFSIGEEAVHFRKFSSQNTIQHSEISDAGLKTPDFGEGVYIGSAKSNWATYTNGDPDRCDSNSVLNNRIGPNVTAECIDVKEGTKGGIIRGNDFDAAGITGANSGDSWMDVKGNNYLIENNAGTNPGGVIFKDGYQVHVAVSGWGNNNEFKNNQCAVNATGYGFNIQLSGSNGVSSGNKVFNNNTVTGAAAGIANIALSN